MLNKQGDRWHQVLPITCILLLVVMLFWGAALLWNHLPHWQMLRIARIKIVTDAQHLSTRELAVQTERYLDGGFFSLNLSELRQHLLQNPWVGELAFHRQWPATLQVTVIEQKPLAVWQQRALINLQGELFTPPVKDFPSNLPQLSGPEGSLPQVLTQYRQLKQRIATRGLSIDALRLTAHHNWECVLNAMPVMLGHEDIEHRVERLLVLYDRVLALRDHLPSHVDLRYPNGAAVEW